MSGRWLWIHLKLVWIQWFWLPVVNFKAFSAIIASCMHISLGSTYANYALVYYYYLTLALKGDSLIASVIFELATTLTCN